MYAVCHLVRNGTFVDVNVTNEKYKIPCKGLTVMHLNIHHLVPKLSQVNVMLSQMSHPVKVLGFSETFLNDRVKDCEIMITGYNMFRRDRTGKLGGGVIVYVADNVPVQERLDLEHPDLEAIWLEVKQKQCKPLLICQIYRPPNSSTAWFDTLEKVLDKARSLNLEIIMMGDFNVDLLKQTSSKDCLLAMAEAVQLAQLLEEPTRIATKRDKETGLKSTTATLIDHVYTSCPERISLAKVLYVSLSDHFGILAVYSNKTSVKSDPGHKFIYYRDMKRLDVGGFQSDLANAPWHLLLAFSDVNDKLAAFYEIYEEILDVHAPVRKKRVKHWQQPEWLNQNILTAMHLRDQLFKQGKNEEYKQMRNTVKSEIARAKRSFYANKISNHAGNSKQMWQCIRDLDGSKAVHFPSMVKNEAGLSVHDDLQIASTFNSHFANICQESDSDVIVEETDESNDFMEKLKSFTCSKKRTTDSFSIPLVTEQFVYDQLQKLDAKKAKGCDNLGPLFLKMSALFIAPVLTEIFNSSISNGIFPDVWKIAKVTPLHKKGPRDDVNNYRPISVLCCLSKILERHVHNSLYEYLSEHDMLYAGQSGFRPKHSCATALTRIVDKWLTALDAGQIVGAVFIDLKKAFDTVNHSILIKKLAMYGCSPAAITWFTSYLYGRSQMVNFRGSMSESKSISRGVPQGSILGPLMFLIFVNDLPLYLSSCETDLYADDTSVYTIGSSVSEIQSVLQCNMTRLSNWCKHNKLSVNIQKTTCMLVASRQKRSHLEESDLTVYMNGEVVPMCENQKILGVHINHEFIWDKQISAVCQSVNYRLYILGKIRYYLPVSARIAFCNGYILPCIDYCSTIWGGTTKKNINKIAKLQKRAARLVFNDFSTPSKELFARLKWLPVTERIKHNKSVVVYKSIHNLMPQYMNELFTAQTNSNYALRSETCCTLEVPKARTELYKQSLTYSGSALFNELPVSLRMSGTLKQFKSKSLVFHMSSL